MPASLGGGANPPPPHWAVTGDSSGPGRPAPLTMDSFSVVVCRTRISSRLLAHGSKSGPTPDVSSRSRFFLEPSYGKRDGLLSGGAALLFERRRTRRRADRGPQRGVLRPKLAKRVERKGSSQKKKTKKR